MCILSKNTEHLHTLQIDIMFEIISQTFFNRCYIGHVLYWPMPFSAAYLNIAQESTGSFYLLNDLRGFKTE